MKLDEKGNSKSDSGAELRGSDDPAGKGSVDYLPYLVLAVAVAVLIVSGTFTVLHYKNSALGPGSAISEWFEDLEREGRDLISRFSGGLIDEERRRTRGKPGRL